MPTLQQLETALINADLAGDVDAARRLAAAVRVARADRVSQIPGMTAETGAAPAPEPGIVDKAIGAGEAALTTVTGATGGTIGFIGGTLKGLAEQILSGAFGTEQAGAAVESAAVRGARANRALEESALRGAQALTYAPRTQSGQEQAAAVGNAMQALIPIAPLAQAAALSNAARASAPVIGAQAAQGTRAATQAVKTAAEKVMPSPTSASARRGSVGAAAVDPVTLREEKAANLPVPVSLTRGAATRDAEQLAFEKEQLKGPLGAPLRERAEQNNLQALQNFDALIDMSAAQEPDLAGAGNRLIRTLAQGYKQAKAKTRAAYTAARKSDEALAPVDIDAVVKIGEGESAIENSLVGYLNSKVTGVRSSAVADAARKTLVKFGLAAEDEAGNLVGRPATVGKLEDFRREMNGVARWDDGPGLRDETIIKKLVDAHTDLVSGPLFKTARALRTEQARKYENRAIVARLINTKRGSDDAQVYADQVFNRTILNASPDEITFLKRVLQTNGVRGKEAWNELGGAMLKYIRDEATKGMGIDSNDVPIVSPAQLHNVVRTLDKNGRLDLVLGKKNGQIVRDLNEVVRYVNTVPPGTLINNSGTVGTLLAAMSEAGATGALTGLPVPVLSSLRLVAKGVKDAKTRAAIKRALGEE